MFFHVCCLFCFPALTNSYLFSRTYPRLNVSLPLISVNDIFPRTNRSSHVILGVSTLRRAVSGEKQNSSGNLKILPGIGRLGKFSGRHELRKLKFRESSDFFRDDSPKIRDDMVLLKQRLLGLSPPVMFSFARQPLPFPHIFSRVSSWLQVLFVAKRFNPSFLCLLVLQYSSCELFCFQVHERHGVLWRQSKRSSARRQHVP